MAWWTKALAAVLALSCSTTVVHGMNSCITDTRCAAGSSTLNFNGCGLTDDDFADLSDCFDTAGRSGIRKLEFPNNEFTMIPSDFLDSMDGLTKLQLSFNSITSFDAAAFQVSASSLESLDLRNNELTTVPLGLLDNMASLTSFHIEGNQLETLPANLFADLESLRLLFLADNGLVNLPADAFVGLSTVEVVYLEDNALTTLPAGIFEDLGDGGLASLHLDGNPDLQCVPTVTASGEWTDDSFAYVYIEPLPTTVGFCECAPSAAVTCGAGLMCSPGALGYTCIECPAGTSMCGDPHMQGLRGQTIDWSGVDGGWYCLVTDDDTNFQVNVRLTAPLPESFPDRQLITGLSIVSGGHSLVIEVANPYNVETNGCPHGISPCLADGGLRAIVDGDEVDVLLRFSRDEYAADGIAVSASNLPVECRQFGGDKIWTRMYEEMLQGRRQLSLEENFEDWILRFDHMAAPDWCTQYIVQHDLAELQSNHAVFRIETSAVTVRLNVGTNYQGSGEMDWDGRVLPDLEFWQMDVGLQGLSLDSESLSGILGETARPVLDKDGHEVMNGYEAFRGTVEDYRVSGSLGTDFALLNKTLRRL